jgi:uncharacterized protein
VLLTDTGPLVALYDRKDPHNAAANAAFNRLREPMFTTPACLAEALYLLGKARGWEAQNTLWEPVRAGLLIVHQEPETGPLRAAAYMERYRYLPCDYADATLLVAAADTAIRRIFTIDPHFYVYRLPRGEALQLMTLDKP